MNAHNETPMDYRQAIDFLRHANVRIQEQILSDGSKVYDLHIGDREFPCLSEKHATDAAIAIGVALMNASNGPRFRTREDI
jgi:hypothetical protein